jgi:hypothetical protein
MNFLPNDGTYFDDEREDDERNEAREARRDPRKIADPNSIALVQEINRRPGVTAFVPDTRTQTEFWKVLELWRSRGHLGMVPLVLIDPKVSAGQVSLRMVGV